MKKLPILWLILTFALLLRVPLLNGSFWLDEAAQALESVRPLSQQLEIVADFQPPLMHYLVHFAAQVSLSEWWLRFWGALLPGLVTVWATFQLGKKLFGQKVAVVASLLLATSSFHIFYSQELRPYSLSAMWALLSTLVLFKKDFQWWKFALLSLAGLYSSYLYPFFLLAQLLVVWQLQHGPQRVLKIVVTLIALWIPWLPMFFQQLATGQTLRADLPGWEKVVSLPQFKALALVPLKFLYGVLNVEATALFAGGALVFLACVALSYKQPIKTKFTAIKQLLLLTLVPLMSSWFVSFFVPVIQPKRLVFLLPFVYLLCAAPLMRQKSPLRVWPLPLFVLAVNLLSTFQYWRLPQLQREDWRGLKEMIIRSYPIPDAVAVFSFDEAFAPWRWYWPESIPTIVTGERTIDQVEDLNAAIRPVTNYKYVLVFDYLRTLTDPDNRLPQAVESLGYEGRGVIDPPGVGFVRIYTTDENAIGYTP